MIYDSWVKNTGNPNLTSLSWNFEFVGVFPRFSDENMQNAHNTCILDKKNEEIPNMTCIFTNFEFVGVFPGYSE